MRNLIYGVMLLLLSVLGGCASFDNYQFGDLSRAYCSSTSPTFRTQIKAELNEKGVSIGMDYCELVGLVDRVREHG